MKLTIEQIDYLYQFTRQHYVEWYDLQTELVDHLANAIESHWIENPKLDFETALQVEFKKFGVFGFMDVVEKRQKMLEKKYLKLIWKHFKTFFTIPKIILTATLIFAIFLLFKSFYSDDLVFWLFVLIVLFLFVSIYINNKRVKKQKTETGKVWLFEHIIFSGGSVASGLFFISFQVFSTVTRNNNTDNDFVLFGLSFFIVSMYLFTYIITKIIPLKAEEYLKETYPEYALISL